MTTFDDADAQKTREHTTFQLQLAECRRRLRECCGIEDNAPQLVGTLIVAMFALCFGLICGFIAGSRHGEAKALAHHDTPEAP